MQVPPYIHGGRQSPIIYYSLLCRGEKKYIQPSEQEWLCCLWLSYSGAKKLKNSSFCHIVSCSDGIVECLALALDT